MIRLNGFLPSFARRLLAASVFATAPLSLAAKDSVPDWVRTAAQQKLPAYPSDTNAVVLLNDTTYTVAPDGTATEHVRRVLKILRPQGRDEGLVFVHFDKDRKLLSLHVWSIAPDGTEFALKDKEIVEVSPPGEGGVLYDDIKFKAAKPAGRDPGGVIAYEYERREWPYVSEATWFLQGDTPHLNQSFTLELPAGYTYSTVWAHHASVKEADLESRRWRWEVNQVPAIDLEHVLHRPSEGALAARMTVHYAPAGKPADNGWQGIGQWYDAISRDRLTATPEIAAKAAELIVGKTDFYDKTEAIGEFVQKQIRYFVIEMGIGGYQPHFVSDIFKNRYGDCKDKASLLTSMLSTVGVHAALLMVDSERGVIDPDAPSILANHMVAAIEIPKGYDSPKLHSVVTTKTGRRYLVFDPTWEARAPFGQIEHDLQGGYGLLMEGTNSEIIQLPLLAPTRNTIHRVGTMKLAADGTLSGTIVEKRFGDVSTTRRFLYTHKDAKEQGDFIDHLLGHDFPTFKLTGMTVENAETLNKELTNTFSFEVERYARQMGHLLTVRPRIYGDEAPSVDHERRTVPIDLMETVQATDDYSIEIPADYTVDELPPAVKLDLGFASYESSTEAKGNTLHYTRVYTVRQVTLPPEKYADLQKLSSTIATDEQSRAVLKKQ